MGGKQIEERRAGKPKPNQPDRRLLYGGDEETARVDRLAQRSLDEPTRPARLRMLNREALGQLNTQWPLNHPKHGLRRSASRPKAPVRPNVALMEASRYVLATLS